MALKQQQRAAVYQVAAILAAGRNQGMMGGSEEEAIVSLQALRLVLKVDTVIEMAEKNSELIDGKLGVARERVIVLNAERDAKIQIGNRAQQKIEAEKALRERLYTNYSESDMDEDDLKKKIDGLVEQQMALDFPDVIAAIESGKGEEPKPAGGDTPADKPTEGDKV